MRGGWPAGLLSVALLATAITACTVVPRPTCDGFYPAGFALTAGTSTDPIAPMAKPARGVRFSEPAYHTCVVRVTNHATDGMPSFARNDYSRRQAFNADATRQLVYAGDGGWWIYNTSTNQPIAELPGPGGDAEPQWHATNRDLLYYLPTNGVGLTIHQLNVQTNQDQVVGDFNARLKARWPSAAAAWTKSEGSPSADSRYWCFMVDDASWSSVGLFTWDRQSDTILGFRDITGDRPDHVSMSPSGDYCVASWDEPAGTVAFGRDFTTQRQVHHRSEHSDIALAPNGDDLYVSVDYESNNGDVFFTDLQTGVRTTLFPSYLAGTATAMHFSGKAFDKPGWVLMSTYSYSGSPRQWLHEKVFIVELVANPRVYQLAHHHSLYATSQPVPYWTEPHASVNRDFTKIAFTSDWDVNTDSDIDAYRIELPKNAFG